MSWTSHDQFFGFIHSFKLNRNNFLLGGKNGNNAKPFPTIVNRPTFLQVWNNWNKADTGLVITFFLAGLLIARRRALSDIMVESIIERRNDYKRYHRLITAFGLFLAMRNSSYRLEGYVPNGLPRLAADDVVKYDYTTDLINNTFWKYIF